LFKRSWTFTEYFIAVKKWNCCRQQWWNGSLSFDVGTINSHPIWRTISTWGKRQLIWGRRQLASACCGCIKLLLPAYCEKQPGIGLYRVLSKCIAHGKKSWFRTLLSYFSRFYEDLKIRLVSSNFNHSATAPQVHYTYRQSQTKYLLDLKLCLCMSFVDGLNYGNWNIHRLVIGLLGMTVPRLA